MTDKLNINCWIVTEKGLTGSENQCLGVSESLGVTPTIKRITLAQPWKTLTPHLRLEQSWSISPRLEPPWPDLLIASGRKAIAASRYIKRMSKGKTFTTYLQDPRCNPAYFDLIALPEHDPTRGKNVLVTTAAPNRITPQNLEQAKAEFQHFKALPSPRIAILIGGRSKAYSMPPALTQKLAEQLKALKTSLMVTTSRRTGTENQAILTAALQGQNHFIWDAISPNPYFGLLAWADVILVTADSASMLSEACSTGKPVYMIPLDGGAPRIDKLHQNLQNMGALREFKGILEQWDYCPLNDAALVANEIKKRMKL